MNAQPFAQTQRPSSREVLFSYCGVESLRAPYWILTAMKDAAGEHCNAAVAQEVTQWDATHPHTPSVVSRRSTS